MDEGDEAVWRQAGERVFADVHATTGLRWNWRVSVHEDEPDWGLLEDQPWDEEDVGDGMWVKVKYRAEIHPPGWKPPRRPLAEPQLWFETDRGSTLLPEGLTVEQATSHLADYVQELVIEDTWTAWPRCPHHDHPLDVGGPWAVSWVCSRSGDVVAEIGSLAQVG